MSGVTAGTCAACGFQRHLECAALSAHRATQCAAIPPRRSGVSEPACAQHTARWAPLVARNECLSHARGLAQRQEPRALLSRSLTRSQDVAAAGHRANLGLPLDGAARYLSVLTRPLDTKLIARLATHSGVGHGQMPQGRTPGMAPGVSSAHPGARLLLPGRRANIDLLVRVACPNAPHSCPYAMCLNV